MSEAKTVLFKRKNELDTKIRLLKEQETKLMKELGSIRSSIKFRERLLQEVLSVYNPLINSKN